MINSIGMNQLSNIKGHEDSAVTSSYSEFCAVYGERELIFGLLSQLNHLVQGVQRHRGISMGLLAGDKTFESELVSLQRQLEKRLSTFDVFAAQRDTLLATRDRENLHMAWRTIRNDWQEDNLSDNFELHSHFIEQLLTIILALAKRLEGPLMKPASVSEVVGAARDGAFPRELRQIELLAFVCSLLPSMIECMAKIRGLSTFAAASGRAEYLHDRKLRFLLGCAREQNEKLRHCAQRLQDVLDGELDALQVIGELETKFVHLMSLVEHDVLSGRAIHASSVQLFDLATVVIDKYWSIVDQGLDLFRLWHRRDLDVWVSE